jgi:hypothetical protein
MSPKPRLISAGSLIFSCLIACAVLDCRVLADDGPNNGEDLTRPLSQYNFRYVVPMKLYPAAGSIHKRLPVFLTRV